METDLNALLPVLREVTESGGEFLIYPRGDSMMPLIRPAKDGVYLAAAKPLRRKDICLYRRENGQFVLHRLVKIQKNGTLLMRGDNQTYTEQICATDVIARVSAVKKEEKRKDPAGFFYLFTHCSALARALRFKK
jgi:phage repressor protein C with HTH and peptisase S24 domain